MRASRAMVVGIAVLMLAAGVGLAKVAGPPRVPAGLPTAQSVSAVLLGATVPLDGLLLVLLDLAWLLWAWICLSLILELILAIGEICSHRSAWVEACRRLTNRLSMPLVRQGMAAAFAVQVLSRGVSVASAQPLPPSDTLQVADAPVADPTGAAAHDDGVGAGAYVVQPGDTLWSIAEQAYGAGTEYRRLVDANVGRSMGDGQVFTARGVIQPGWRLLAPGATWHMQIDNGEAWYTVQAGDTLSSIAASVLGDASRWTELFALNQGAVSPDGRHTLMDANTIWPDLRLRLPDSASAATASSGAAEPDVSDPVELREASAPPQPSDPDPPSEWPAVADHFAAPEEAPAPTPTALPPLVRTSHALQPVELVPADAATDPVNASPTDVPAPADSPDAAVPSEPSVRHWQPGVPALPLVLGGIGLASAAGLVFGARRLRRLRPLPKEPESEVVVEGGFAEALPTQDLTRGLHGAGFDPLAALVAQLERFLAEYDLQDVGIVAIRHGRSSTTLTLRCGLADQPVLLDVSAAFGERLDAETEACISSDQDVLLRLVRLRKTRLLPTAAAEPSGAYMVPLGVLYDRQMFAANWQALGHLLVVSLPGHGADTILTSLIATLTARRSPEQLRLWLLASARSLPGPLFQVPHLARSVDPSDRAALEQAIVDLRAEIDRRAGQVLPGSSDLVVVVPELAGLGEDVAGNLALLAPRALEAGVRFILGSSDPDGAVASPLTPCCASRLVLRMESEESSVALLGVADAAFLGGGGRLLLRMDDREAVELYGYQVTTEHLERLVKVMRSAYPAPAADDRPIGPAAEPNPNPPANPLSPAAEPAEAPDPRPDDGPSPTEEAAADSESPTGETLATSTAPPIQIFCFGRPYVECAGQVVWPRAGGDAKPWEFMLFLACNAVEGVSRETVVQALWPEDELPEESGHRFRQLRYRLRRQLQAVPNAPETDGVYFDRRQLRFDPCVIYSDAQEFLTQLKSVRLNPGVNAIERLERARALYVGDLFEGPDVRRYTWIDERDDSGVTLREHFRRLFQNATLRLAELYVAQRSIGPAIELYRELTEMDPCDEEHWRALFRLHAERGDREALIAEEQRLRQTLRDLAEDADLNDPSPVDEPGRETMEEFRRLLAGLPQGEPAAV